MFCYHCQEAKKNIVCDVTGICGKKEEVSCLQDLLMYSIKGLAFYAHKSLEFGITETKTDQFTTKALFSMVTNVNFDQADFVALIAEANQRRNSLRTLFLAAYLQKHALAFSASIPKEAQWQFDTISEEAFVEKGASVVINKDTIDDEDLHGIQECLLYAIKGLASLAVHARALNAENQNLYHFIYKALNFTLQAGNSVDSALAMNIKCGEMGIAAMLMLDKANTAHFGHQQPTTVHKDVWDKPGILVTGHDMQDIKELLQQTAGTGIDIYTHGEAITAHAYSAFKKFFNLAGNYGNAWQDQRTQFSKFKGPILVSTNSIQQQKKDYKDKIYTTGMVGWPGVQHIADRKPGQSKDFSQLIEQAKTCETPTLLAEGKVSVGYAHHALAKLLPAITEAINNGDIKHIIVLAGCDGRHKERRYYTQLAEALPKKTLVLTAGDNKYRFHDQDFGFINGIPRLLDAGQSNDLISIILFLQSLQKSLNLLHFNELPVSYNIAWYEQKSIIIMLALFSMNVKNLRLGPTLPPFFSANILTLLAEKFSLKGIDTVENDVVAMMDGL
ncbi:MAG: hydroxylamine reductase [Methylococcales symbiont of Hymedesmia sp. n. MRB-2018]|nr:MAG: hydroxylamine reductase [Methylococcales symbiont of Hymedesmia sp. n. MRB-2018]KAF3984415.1 MAG: hydroxylamine reductase [Methylococcales symbiont of Hymedesmia sp. n. MRB-2018]